MENAPLSSVNREPARATVPPFGQPNLYEREFYQWAQQTVTALKAQAFDQVDWDNVIEEIESIGRRERRELKSRLILH